ncbi:MAG TPA: class I SAM-dependent methyltransferase [Iamia sp.]|jgi:SAM-dependent methyltransferase|nr:class I SAM-dependent methyltransferase [Iamia sp.]
MSETDPLDATRRMWSIGSYATMGDVFAAAGRDLVATVGVEGLAVLDVACGTGNTALAAVRAGAAHVTGVDLTPALLEEAARRAETEGLADRVTWHEADMAALPVADAGYDRVLSTFGAMFATDQRRVGAELRRACRPGGTVAVTAWAIDGLFDRMTETLLTHAPEPPPPGPGPRDWARVEDLARIFGVAVERVALEERTIDWRVESADAAVALVEANAAPIIMLRQRLGDGWPAARADLVALFGSLGTDSDDGIVLPLAFTLATLTEAGSPAP